MSEPGPMHHLVIGPRKASTACGIRVEAYYPMSLTALPVHSPKINCVVSPDYVGAEITCRRCRENAGRPALTSQQSGVAND